MVYNFFLCKNRTFLELSVVILFFYYNLAVVVVVCVYVNKRSQSGYYYCLLYFCWLWTARNFFSWPDLVGKYLITITGSFVRSHTPVIYGVVFWIIDRRARPKNLSHYTHTDVKKRGNWLSNSKKIQVEILEKNGPSPGICRVTSLVEGSVI